MKNSFFAASLLFFAAIVIASCNKEPEKVPLNPVPITLSASQAQLVDSGNSFAFDIFKKVAEAEQTEKNLIISPFSISTALSMAVNGANGQTKEGMLTALRSAGLSLIDLNTSYKGLSESLLGVDKRVLLNIANSMWIEKNFPVKVPFKSALTDYYKAEARSFDISNAGVPKEINSWIEGKTNGLIKNMVEQLDPQTVMLLINAIYFKGMWNSQFDKSETVNETFHVSDASTVQVPMMKQKAKFKICKGQGFTLAEFPYGQGNFVMDVLLPDNVSGANAVIQSLTKAGFNDLVSKLYETEIDLSFPRFKYSYKKTMNEILKDMGMAQAFTDLADFTNISDVRVLISMVLHQAFIETNEEGTEAAAATIIGIYTTSLPAGPLVLKLDHPFVYIIRETSTNSILFMGKVVNPLDS
jgi:serpin B